MRTLNIKDKKFISLIEEKGRITEEGRAVTKEIEGVVAKHAELIKKHQDLFSVIVSKKKKIFKEMKKLIKNELSEFEVVEHVDLKDGDAVVTITNQLDEFQAQWRKHDKWSEPLPPKR